MFFFTNPKLIFYLRPQGIEIYQNKGQISSLEFPKDVTSFQEILNPQKFDQILAESLEKLNLRGKKIILLISEQMLFEKSFPATIGYGEIEKFIATVPFEEKTKVILSNDKQQKVFVTNLNLLTKIARVIKNTQGELLIVVPASILNIPQNVPLDNVSIKTILKENFSKEADFLQNNNSINFSDNQKGTSNLLKTILLIIILVCLLGVGLFVITKFKIIKLPISQKSEQPALPSSLPVALDSFEQASPSAKEASQSAQINKADLTVQIYNGTGIAGQAALVKDKLANLGYLRIEIGNAEGANAKDTVVAFTPKLTSEIKAEVNQELENLFKTVSNQDASSSAQFDILITTGAVK